jgi:hypothetical protein
MLFTFQSATSGGLMMFDKGGKEILALLGQDPEEARGIITAEQLPGAISALKTALATDKAKQPEKNTKVIGIEEAGDQKVSLFQRVVPFIQMLERAEHEKESVIWGV